MTSRLQKAIGQLPPDKIEQLADYAEFLASQRSGALQGSDSFLNLDWIGVAKELSKEYASGVDAAHAAQDFIVENVDRKMRR